MGPLSIYNTQKNTLTPSTSSFTSTENPSIPFEMPHLQSRDNGLSRTAEAAKRVLVQPLFSYPNSVTGELNDIFNLKITELQTLVSQIVSTNWVTDHHYMILQKYQKTFANLVTDVNQAKTDRLITEEEREKAESLLGEANKFANKSAKIVGGLLAYQDAAENLHLAMEDFTEISYDSDEGYGDPLLGMPAMDHMINQFKKVLHSTNNFSDIQDRYIDDLKAMELVLEPFCKELDRKINYECSILVPLLSDSRHSREAFVQLKVLHKQISFMNGILQKIRPKINECKERWSLLSANRDTTASNYLQTINKHLNELDGRLKKFHQIIGRELNKTRLTARTDNIIYGKRTWKSLVKNRPEAHQGFFGKLFSYLNPNNYLPKIGPISPQKKAALILALVCARFGLEHYQLIQRAANMRSEADHLQKLARASIPPEIREQVDTEIAVIATAFTYKFPFMSKDPTLIAKLTKRTPQATEFLSKAVERCGSNAPSQSVIKQLMQDYENIRLSSYLPISERLTLSDWFNTFTCSQDSEKENQSVKSSSSAELNVPIERVQIKPPLTNEGLLQIINEIPLENAPAVTIEEWSNKLSDPNHPLQASENIINGLGISNLDILVLRLYGLSESNRLTLFKKLACHRGIGYETFLRLAKIALKGMMQSSTVWSDLIKELTNNDELSLNLAKLFIDLASENPSLKYLLNLKDNHKRTPLFWFIRAGDRVSTEKLLKLGVDDVKSADVPYEKTPLHYAIEIDDIKVVKLLIKYGADPLQFHHRYGNCIVTARTWENPQLEDFFAKNYPALKAEADEFYLQQNLAQKMYIGGESTLFTTNKKISFDSFSDSFFFHRDLARNIRKLGAKGLILSNEVRNTIVNALEAGSRFYSPAGMLSDFHADLPVLIPTGWSGRSAIVVLYQSSLVICNAQDLIPIKAYKINSANINEELITNLISLKEKASTKFQNFIAPNGPLLTQLGCSESTKCLNPYFYAPYAESHAIVGSQGDVNNSAWHSLNIALYVLIRLLDFPQRIVPVSTLLDSAQLRLQNIAFQQIKDNGQKKAIDKIYKRDKSNKLITSKHQTSLTERILNRSLRYPNDYSQSVMEHFQTNGGYAVVSQETWDTAQQLKKQGYRSIKE